EPWARRAGEQDPMNEKREVATKFRVGVFVLVALATFLGAVYALGARARLFEARYTTHVEFTEVGGLCEGATVRLAGVRIGRVSGVNLPPQPGGKVRVDLTIGRRFSDRIRKNSVARIETQGLLGDRIVEITVGEDRKSTRLNSSHVKISYAVFCLKKKKKNYSHFKIKIYYKCASRARE